MNLNNMLVPIATIMALTLSGCVVAPAGRPYYRETVVVARPYYGEPMMVALPPSRDGHYGQHWVAHQWVREGDRWRLHEGRWENHDDHRDRRDGRDDHH